MTDFPNPNWQSSLNVEALLPSKLRSWVLYPGSFMERLKEHDVEHASIQVLLQDWQNPLEEEKKRLDNYSDAMIREVLIANKNTVFMYARTVFSREILREEQSLAHLENRSLGSVLFKNPSLQRSEFELALLQPGMDWYEKIARHVAIQSEMIWARRSLFHLRGQKLLLTEVFLPDMETLCK